MLEPLPSPDEPLWLDEPSALTAGYAGADEALVEEVWAAWIAAPFEPQREIK